MGHHFVGRIFLFHEPPPVSPFQLSIPALGDEAALPEAVLLNVPDENLSERSRARKHEILARSALPEELVMRFAQYGPTALDNCSNHIRTMLMLQRRDILWRGNVGFPELAAVFEIAWRHLRFNRGRLSPREAALFANRLRLSRTLRAYFDGLIEDKSGPERAEAIEKGFRALSAFDYGVPKVLLDMDALVNYHCEQLRFEPVDYSYMAYALDNLFAHHWVKALEEYGVPFPLAKRLSYLVSDVRSLEDAVEAVRHYSGSEAAMRELSPIERNIIAGALE
jgi:hypothetical protein